MKNPQECFDEMAEFYMIEYNAKKFRKTYSTLCFAILKAIIFYHDQFQAKPTLAFKAWMHLARQSNIYVTENDCRIAFEEWLSIQENV